MVLLNSHPAWHRLLTDLTHLVYAAVCVSGTWVALDAYKRRMPNLVNTKPLPYVILNLTELFGYAVCYPLAVYYDTAHQDTGAYARLILFASTCLILPAAARLVSLLYLQTFSLTCSSLPQVCAAHPGRPKIFVDGHPVRHLHHDGRERHAHPGLLPARLHRGPGRVHRAPDRAGRPDPLASNVKPSRRRAR